MNAPFDDLHCEYALASGADQLNCAWITRRWRDSLGTTLSDSDFCICADTPDQVRFWGPWPNILSGIWRALPSGRVYVTDAAQGSVHVYDDVIDTDPSKCRLFELGFAPEGVWGLSEEQIYAWGIRQPGDDQQPHLARFDGKQWQEMANPGFYITKMHGLAPDLIYAAGRGGMARWDGQHWSELPLPSAEILSDVFVAGPEEIYATSYSGALLEGTAKGLSVIARTVNDRLPYACVAKFADELFVGGASLGLFRRIGKTDQLEHIKPNVHASSFDARAGSLLITTPSMVVGTTDGQAFQGAAVNAIHNVTQTIDILEE